MSLYLKNKEKSRGNILLEDTFRGYEYVVAHNGLGYRVGYVKIPEGHPWFAVHYDDIDAQVHGGLTYSAYGYCEETGGAKRDEWWIGFDCAHAGDEFDERLVVEKDSLHEQERGYIDLMRKHNGYGESTIKSTSYVREECMSLCKQAKAEEKTK